jgi:hypothetical protein
MKIKNVFKILFISFILLFFQNCNGKCNSHENLPMNKDIAIYFNVFFKNDYWIYKNKSNKLDTLIVAHVDSTRSCNNDGSDCFCIPLINGKLQGNFMSAFTKLKMRIDDRFRIIDTINNNELLSVLPLNSALYDESTGKEPIMLKDLIILGRTYYNVIIVSNQERNGQFYFAEKVGIIRYTILNDSFDLFKTNKL